MQDFTNMMSGRFDFLYEYGDYSPEGFLPFFYSFTPQCLGWVPGTEEALNKRLLTE